MIHFLGILSLILLLFGSNILLMAYTLSFWKKPLFMVLIVLSLATTLVGEFIIYDINTRIYPNQYNKIQELFCLAFLSLK